MRTGAALLNVRSRIAYSVYENCELAPSEETRPLGLAVQWASESLDCDEGESTLDEAMEARFHLAQMRLELLRVTTTGDTDDTAYSSAEVVEGFRRVLVDELQPLYAYHESRLEVESGEELADVLLEFINGYSSLLEALRASIDTETDMIRVRQALQGDAMSALNTLVNGHVMSTAESLVASRELTQARELTVAQLQLLIAERELEVATQHLKVDTWIAELAQLGANCRAQAAGPGTARMLSLVADAERALVDTEIIASNDTAAWSALSRAATLLTTVAQHDPEDPDVWEARGDVEVQRAELPTPTSRHNAATLHKNAAVFYRRAQSQLRRHGGEREARLAHKMAQALVQ